jgi:hypothetical protein
VFILTPFWTSRFSEKKNLEYSVNDKTYMNNETSVAPTKDWPDKRVTYKGRNVKDATFSTVTFTNTGQIPIKAEDFDRSVTFNTSKPNSLLAFRLVGKFPSNLKPELALSAKGLVLKPLLLNPGDSFIVQIFCSSDSTLDSVDGRIAGLRQITEYKQEKYSGLSIENVAAQEFGRTIQKPLLRLPSYVVIGTTFSCITLAVLALTLNWGSTGTFGKLVLGFLCAGVYVIGIVSASLLHESLLGQKAPPWTQYLMLIFALTLPSVSAMRAQKLFKSLPHTSGNLQQKELIDPKHPSD